MEDLVLLERNGGVAEIVLNRPQKMNAVTPAMALQLEDLARVADRDPEVRVVLLRGAGERAFCSGSDLRALEEYPTPWRFRNRIEYATVIRNLRKPVIAALQGWCLGGGAEMALAADVRIIARGCRFGFPEVTRGWVGGGGASQMLPRLVGYGQAMHLLLSGEAIPGDEAHRLGMAEVLAEDADLLATARAYCVRLASYSPIALESVKAAVRMSMMATLGAGIAYENELNTLCMSVGDHQEGIDAFKERRGAVFNKT